VAKSERKILIDTDGGVDDLLALFVVSRLVPPPSLHVAVTFGNVPRDRALQNVSMLAALQAIQFGAVLRGRTRPLEGVPEFALRVHGSDGIGGASNQPEWNTPPLPTKELQEEKVGAQYGCVVAIGPLSDIAIWARDLEQDHPPLCVMGGAFDVPGNVSSTAEFNFRSDPNAAREIFDTYPNRISVVSLDVCRQVVLTREHLRRLCELNPSRATSFLNTIHQHYMDYYRTAAGIDGCYPHDTICVCAALSPDLFSWVRGRVSIVVDGPERGRSLFVEDSNGRHFLAKDIDRKRFFTMVEKAVLGPILGKLGSGEAVYDSIESHVRDHPTVIPYLKDALSRIDAQHRDRCYEEVEFSKVIGYSLCVPTRPGDLIVYAQRKGRRGLTRFVKERVPEPCSSVVVALAKTSAGYILKTAYVGHKAPAEPWDHPYATADSIPFWNTHAIVWGHEAIIPDTEISTSPW